MRRPVPSAAAWMLPTATACGTIGLLAPNPVVAGALSAAVAVPVGAAQFAARRRAVRAEHRAEREALAARADAAHAAWLDGDTTKDEDIVAGSTALIQALLDAPNVTPAQVKRIEEEFAHPAGPLRCNLASLRRDLLEEETPRAELGEPTSVGPGGCLQWLLPEHVRPLPADGHRMIELTRGHQPGGLRLWEEEPIPAPNPEPEPEQAPQPEIEAHDPAPPASVPIARNKLGTPDRIIDGRGAWRLQARFRPEPTPGYRMQEFGGDVDPHSGLWWTWWQEVPVEPPVDRAAEFRLKQAAEAQARSERKAAATGDAFADLVAFKESLIRRPLVGLVPVQEDYAVVHEWGVLDRVRVDRVTRRYPHL